MSGALKRDEWETVRLGDEMKSMPRVLIPDVLYFQEGPGVRNTQYTLSGVKLLNVSNLHDGFVDLSTSNRYISEDEAYGRYSHFLVDEGDFIIASSGIKIESFDTKMGFIDKSHLPLCMNTSTIRFKVLDDSKLSIRYFMYYLKSDDFKKQLFHHITGSAQLNFGPSHLKKMTFPLPPLDIQRRIADTLDKVSELITLRKTQLKKLDELVKARFVEMFGDPVINPKSWVTAPLSALILNANNGMARRGKDADGSIVLRLVELQNGFIDYSAPNRICLNETEKKRYELVDNDFLFARVNGNPDSVGRCAVFKGIGEPVFHNDHIIRVHFDETKLNGCFTSVLLNSDYGKRQMREQIKTSAGQYTISQDGIGVIMTILPPMELQNQFAAFVEQTDKSKVIIQQSLDALETLKKSLMQEYFG